MGRSPRYVYLFIISPAIATSDPPRAFFVHNHPVMLLSPSHESCHCRFTKPESNMPFLPSIERRFVATSSEADRKEENRNQEG